MADRQPTLHTINSLLSKLDDPDPDIRYMSLEDLLSALNNPNSAFLSQDISTTKRLSEGLLKSLYDQHGEVQNQALKCLNPLVPRLPIDTLQPLIEKLTTSTTSQSIDTSVLNTALRVVIASLPSPHPGTSPSQEALSSYAAISKVLIPRLTGTSISRSTRRGSDVRGMLEKDPSKGFSSDAIDVLIEVVNCFGSLLKDGEIAALQASVMAIIETDTAGTVAAKRSLVAISALVLHFSEAQLSGFVSTLLKSFRSSNLTLSKRRHLIATVGSLARAAPSKFGPYLKTLAPFILAAVSESGFEESREEDSDDGEHDPQLDELKETTLVTIEVMLASCTQEMQPFLMDAIQAALRYLKYDPNVAFEEDEQMGGTQDEGSEDDATEEPDEGDDEFDDFEEEGGYSDVDDISWKVRRCAAKMLYTVVSTYGTGHLSEDGTLYQQIAPSLISRFGREREESVKLEVITTLTAVVRKTSDGIAVVSANSFIESVGGSRNSRKRRRQDSFVGEIDFESSSPIVDSPVIVPISPESGPQVELARLTPTITQNLVKMWKRAPVALKQVGIVLLRSLALARLGGLADFLQQIEDPIADALKGSTPTGSTPIGTGISVSGGTLQIETLSLIAAIAETHTSNALLPFLIALIPGVISSVKERNYKVSSAALGAVEHIVKALTPPRISADGQDLSPQLEKIYDVIVFRVTDTSADLEVRQRAIHVLGILLARTSGADGAKFVSPDQRSEGLTLLVDRLRNETTRLAAARAVDDVAVLATSKDDTSPRWVGDVTAELGSQLRKSDRTLRASCLEALRSLAMNFNTRLHFDEKTIRKLEAYLIPLIRSDDLHLLAPALIILAKLLPGHARIIVNNELVSALCTVVIAPLVGIALKALLLLIKVIGEEGAGGDLMKRFLQEVGINGDPSAVGRAIGTLLVYGGSNTNVKMEDFLRELQTARDNQRKCLALAILGEFGLRMGSKSALEPKLFISNFDSKSDKVRLAAAVALGNAAASNIKTYMPVILDGLEKSSSSNYLLLHSVKELLQHPDIVRNDIAPFATKLWEILLTAAEDEDNRVVGAECIGRLALIDSASYLPHLHEYLSNEDPKIRGIIISAFRYTLSDSSHAYNDVLRPLISPLLVSMLSDRDLGNHRLALTTLNSAIHNKMDIILPHLKEFLPAVVGDTQIKPELIREVQMGPFKHKVDDGLELRKSAYETLYACLDSAFARAHITEFFDRILAGIDDEQDIRTLCNLMTAKMITIAPEETRRNLDALSEHYRVVLSIKPKENAVKQELEKAQEASLGILKISRELDKAFPIAESSGEHLKWNSYVDWIRKTFSMHLRALDSDS